ncbi:DUF2634 domain-containing protein [Brevibacillus formosus]|uniref:DUF2634 domain-containing protein n=1 Tax=Brevibacillus formosus TaxID=54913 RepID=UPI000B5A9F89|nr:DUF2634 domain-containing protein [Brevibacillus formosus]
MSIPEIGKSTPQYSLINASYDLGVTYLFDFKKKDFIYKEGKPVEVTGIEALKVWICKIIYTEKHRFRVYEGLEIDYGVTLEEFIVGKKYPTPFVQSEIKREITEALLLHPRISYLSDWSFTRDENSLEIAFTVNLVDAQSFTIQEVIWYGRDIEGRL